MACLKCGKDTTENTIFCEDCAAEMEKYPVKPGTPVQLPKRTEHPNPIKLPKRRAPSPEEQIKRLKKAVRILSLLLSVFVLLTALLVYPAVKYLLEDHFLPGQNYSVITIVESTDGEQAP